ncbi:Xbp1 [Drosophila busckii]|uniref:Xbp1 n=2 Tax=Drosophila busckii TaxID=30019 RepID=A0A0M5J9Y7_DROBS|nr:Xbp1 [Drosophila busckii]
MKPPTTKTKIISAAAFIQAPTPDTVYGTYDAKTNSITIVMDDDTEPINEAVEIIYGDGVSACDDSTEAMCPPRATSPTEVFLSVINATDESDDETTSHLNFEPMESFLSPRVKAISPLAKSPALSMHSAISDHGYESIMGSPASTTLTHLDSDVNMPASEEDEFLWESNFDELFPSLI